ncbi:hypothetical protein DYBT9275_05580 [Dyadobacter sp. CECT 9275]|uniref:Oxygen sensor histidine kinase NreB n=1 Tax=Dyadobacter helix TaxID=2822344 RepID=A0A916JK74_9BACT|nr:sensor histidine kinase [Dyadobacter sp. CECT 9275]CAG5016557.1 hypothetical protein DYBT9275_05580 [Dyadobacter sp. CECT 9275]
MSKINKTYIIKFRILTGILLFINGLYPSQAQDFKTGLFSDKGTASAQSADFPRDTVLINKYNQLAKKYLYHDAMRSFSYAQKALALCQKHNWGKGKLYTYNLLSTYYLIDGSFDILRELSNEGLDLSSKLSMPLYSAYAERFLAESYTEYKDWQKAEQHYQNALKTFTRYKDDSARALCLENIANFYREQGDLKRAVEYYDLSYKLHDQRKSDQGKASVLQSKGYMYVRNGVYDRAEKLMLTALKLYEGLDHRYGILNVLNDLGNIYYYTEEYDKSIEASKTALELAHLYHCSQQINWALICLAKAYKQKGDLVATVKYLEQVNFNRRLMHNERIERQFTMSQLIFENKRMDSKIQQDIIKEQRRIQLFLIGFICLVIAFALFLWFTNKRLRRKNRDIKEALIQGQTIERKRVAAELHDHLGGTLASLNWYLFGINKKLLSEEERKFYESVHQMVGKAYRELRTLSHNLMPEELTEHGLVITVQRLLENLNENNTIVFTFETSGLDRRLSPRVEFEVYSIVLELTNNIIKHSAARKALISLIDNETSISLTISDDGQGIKMNSGQGIGLGNVRSRVQSLAGKLNMETESGTTIRIEIPKTSVY